jgi:hypothetical protein
MGEGLARLTLRVEHCSLLKRRFAFAVVHFGAPHSFYF